jgi:hypothetical protein
MNAHCTVFVCMYGDLSYCTKRVVLNLPFFYFGSQLALTSPTGGGRSVGIVRSRTKAMEFSLVYD